MGFPAELLITISIGRPSFSISLLLYILNIYTYTQFVNCFYQEKFSLDEKKNPKPDKFRHEAFLLENLVARFFIMYTKINYFSFEIK